MNAPPGFQHFINGCLVGLSDKVCNAYLDDVLTLTKTFEQHVEDLHAVLQGLKAKGVKGSTTKDHLFKLIWYPN